MAKVDFLTPVGRLVMGDAFKPQTTDMQGNPLTIKSGPNAGKPTQTYILHVAVAKNDPEVAAFYQKLMGAARAAWPQYFDAAGNCTHPGFSSKFVDGDGPDGNGQSQAHKEGYAGHYIIKTSSTYPPRVFYKDHYAPHEEVKDPNLLKRGYFVRVGGQIDSNGFPTKPGMKVYAGQVAIWAQGPEITSGPDAAAVFGQAGAGMALPGMQALPTLALPAAGQLAMPGAPAGPLAMPGLPGAMTTAQPAPTLPGAMPLSALPAATSAMPGMPALQPTLVTPNPSLMALPGLPGMPAAAAVPLVPQLTPMGAATGQTYAQMIAAGYQEAQLRQAGYIF